jgi:CheY-like chemotaxis protein
VSRTTADERQSTKTLDDVRVMVVDDHDLFRTGLKNLLEEQGVNIVG